jgi:hypothetical protein
MKHLQPMQILVYAAIKRAGRAGVSLERLEALLNEHCELRRLDPPKDTKLRVRVTVNYLNRWLKANKLARVSDARGGDRRYRLEYDPDDDIRRSVVEAFATIRERKAGGGAGWGE